MKRLKTVLGTGAILALAIMGCEKKGEAEKTSGEKQAAREAPAQATEAKPEAKPETEGEAAAASPAMQLLDAAIQARGGAEKIRAASAWTGKSKGVYMGMPYTSTNTYQAGHLRMDIDMPDGSVMSMVMGEDQCWNRAGKVVVPCGKKEKQASRLMMALEKATQLVPLKEKGWELEAEKIDIDGKAYDKLVVKHPQRGFAGEIVFDPDTHLMVQSSYRGTLNGKEGTFLARYTENQTFCGLQLPAKIEITFNGKPYLQEEMTEVNCGGVDSSVFAKPEQVAHGTVEQKKTSPATVACVTMKGPYRNTPKAMGRLMKLMGKKKLAPMGAPILIYKKGPPRVKKPRKFVTEVCLPVGARAPKKPKKMGKLTLKAMKPATVLSIYGIGPYQKSGKLAGKLMKEAMKRKLKTIGPMRQISYMDPQEQPADQLVSEMQIPIKARKGKIKGRKKVNKRGKKKPRKK